MSGHTKCRAASTESAQGVVLYEAILGQPVRTLKRVSFTSSFITVVGLPIVSDPHCALTVPCLCYLA